MIVKTKMNFQVVQEVVQHVDHIVEKYGKKTIAIVKNVDATTSIIVFLLYFFDFRYQTKKNTANPIPITTIKIYEKLGIPNKSGCILFVFLLLITIKFML